MLFGHNHCHADTAVKCFIHFKISYISLRLQPRGEGTFTRVERWALKRLSGILPIESLWTFNSKYQPDWFPRHLVYPAVESFVPVVAAVLRAESLTEIPVLGRFLKDDPTNRPGTVVPPEILEAAALSNKEGAS